MSSAGAEPAPRDASSPWSGQGPSPRDRESGRRARRVLEHAVVLLLLAAGALVLATGYPLVLGLVEGHRPEAAHRGLDRYVRGRGWAVGEPAPQARSRYAPSPHSGIGRPGGFRGLGELLFEEINPDDPAPTAEAHLAMARGPLVLRDRAEDLSPPVHTVTPDTMMFVAKDTGDWLLLAIREEGRTVLGWARREKVAVLP